MMSDSLLIAAVLIALAVAAYLGWRSRSGGSLISRGPTATELLPIVQRLQKSDAQWPEILATVNPGGSRSIANSLTALRGPHQFVPHLGLNVLEDGCRRALKRNPNASLADAMEEALRSANIVVRAGD